MYRFQVAFRPVINHFSTQLWNPHFLKSVTCKYGWTNHWYVWIVFLTVVPHLPVNLVPFLILGIGIDDALIILDCEGSLLHHAIQTINFSLSLFPTGDNIVAFKRMPTRFTPLARFRFGKPPRCSISSLLWEFPWTSLRSEKVRQTVIYREFIGKFSLFWDRREGQTLHWGSFD